MLNEFFNVEKMKFIDKHYEYICYDDIKDNDHYVILDLRTSKEFNFKHLKNSNHFPLLDDITSIKLEGMFENRTYFSTTIKSIFYITPKLIDINRKIKAIEKDKIVVLACRHARIRSRSIAMFVNILGSNALVLKYGVNTILNIDKKDILYPKKNLS